MSRVFRALALSLAFLALSNAASAQATPQTPPPQAAADQEARAMFEAGRIAFDNGRYTQALDMFQRAYDLSHRVGLLYNIGSTLDRLRRDREALGAFRTFLEGDPTTSRRAEVEERIRILEQQVAASESISAIAAAETTEAEPEQPATDPAATPAARRTPITRRWWFWTIIGVAVVGTAVGVGVGVSDHGTQGPQTVDSNTMVFRL